MSGDFCGICKDSTNNSVSINCSPSGNANGDHYYSFDVEIDNNLYGIITEWVRCGRRFQNRDELISACLDEYEDRYLRSQHYPDCSRFNHSTIFKSKIATNRRYTSRRVHEELSFLFNTNRYHIKSLISEPTAACVHDGPCGGCSCCPPGMPMVVTVDEYIKNLIKTNYDQALVGLNKTSIIMSLPQYINRQEFDTKMRSICEVDTTTYKLRTDLEVF